LEDAILALKDEAYKEDVNLWDLFITGNKGNIKGFLSEQEFTRNLSYENIKLKPWEIQSLIDQFYDPSSDKLNCNLLLR